MVEARLREVKCSLPGTVVEESPAIRGEVDSSLNVVRWCAVDRMRICLRVGLINIRRDQVKLQSFDELVESGGEKPT